MRVDSPLFLAAAFGVLGCSAQSFPPVPEDCQIRELAGRGRVSPIERADVLLLVDGASGLDGETVRVRSEEIIREMVGGDFDGDGFPEAPPFAENLHIGVASTDLGAGGHTVLGCTAGGDGGKLVMCDGLGPPYISVNPGADPAAAADRVSCMLVQAMSRTCAFPQPLFAVERVLEADNDGFRRPGVPLYVVIITAGDDCSSLDASVFDPRSDLPLDTALARCLAASTSLVAVEDVLEQIRGRLGESYMGVLLIAGIPPDLLADGASLDSFDGIVADPRMRAGVTSCTAPGIEATAPVRLLEAARALSLADPYSVFLGSVCDESWLPGLRALFPKIGDTLRIAACLPYALAPRPEDGLVDCEVTEQLSQGDHHYDCESLVPLGREGEPVEIVDGQLVCRIRQVPAPAGAPSTQPGWYYVANADACGEGGQIQFTDDSMPLPGSLVELRCFTQEGVCE